MNKGFKMKDYKRFLAFLATTILVLAIVPPTTLAELEALPEPFVTNGVFNAYIVVGEGAAVSDVIGAIEVAAAFAQKAVTPVAGATGGEVSIAVKTFAGVTGKVQIGGQTDTDVVTNYTVLPNNTYVDGNYNYTAVEKVTIDKANLTYGLQVYFPNESIINEITLYRDSTQLNVSDWVGHYIWIFGVKYYVANSTGNNLTVGSSESYDDVTLPFTVTSGGHTITVNAIDTVNNIARIVVDGTTYTTDTNGTLNVADLTIKVSDMHSWSTPTGTELTVDVDIISSKVVLESGKETPILSGWKFTKGTNSITFTKESDVTLNLGESYQFPLELNLAAWYTELDKTTTNKTLTVKESDDITAQVVCADTYCTINPVAGGKWYYYNATWDDWFPISAPDNVTVIDGSSPDNPIKVRLVDPTGAVDADKYVEFRLYDANTTDGVVDAKVYGIVIEENQSGAKNILDSPGESDTTSKGTFINFTNDKTVDISVPGVEMSVDGTPSYYTRKDVSGVYDAVGKALTEAADFGLYGIVLSYDGSANKLTITEPNGNSMYIKFGFNSTGKYSYFAEVSIPSNNTETSYGTLVVYNVKNLVEDTEKNAEVNFTIFQKEATYGMGGYKFGEPKTLAAGESATFDSTEVKVMNITGVGGVTVNPVEVGFAKLDSELSVLGVDKPVIIVGGPAINTFAAQLITADEIGEGNYLIRYFDATETPFGQPALVIAGWEKEDTLCACKHVAGYLLSDWPPLTGTSEVHACSEYFASI